MPLVESTKTPVTDIQLAKSHFKCSLAGLGPLGVLSHGVYSDHMI